MPNKLKEERLKEILADLTLLDDIMMSQVFDNNIPVATLLLKVIIGKQDIKVISVIGQKVLKSTEIGGRSIKLDILAEDSEGRRYNVEIQRSKDGADERRARFHSSMLDVRMLKAGQEFKELVESYVIFITEMDYFKERLPIYSIDRVVKETKKNFFDGSHIIYVNGEYEGNDEIGKLIHDLKEKNAKNMYNKELADSLEYFKEKGDERVMSSKWEEYVQEIREEEREKAKKKIAEVERKIAKAELKAELKAAKAEKEASLLTTITAGIAYGVGKDKIVERLCNEFKLTKSAAEKKYEKYAVKMA